MERESVLQISRLKSGANQFFREAILTFPFLAEYTELKFHALGIQLPTTPNVSHAQDDVATFRYIARCINNDVIPYSCVKFELEESYPDKSKNKLPLILASGNKHIYQTRVINRAESVQIVDKIIKVRAFHELDFNLYAGVSRNSLSSFREQCLENVFRQNYEIGKGRLSKFGEVNGRTVNTHCFFEGTPGKGSAMLVRIEDKTDKRHLKTLSDWAQDLAGKYKGEYKAGLENLQTS